MFRSYSGYIDIGPRHLFFYFFESRKDPDTDDVMMWLSGGPGCSAVTSVVFEQGACSRYREQSWSRVEHRAIGPCRVKDYDGDLLDNPFPWNTNANLIAIDQPIDVGFSYADFGETVVRLCSPLIQRKNLTFVSRARPSKLRRTWTHSYGFSLNISPSLRDAHSTWRGRRTVCVPSCNRHEILKSNQIAGSLCSSVCKRDLR